MNAIRNSETVKIIDYSNRSRISYKLTLSDKDEFKSFEIFLEGILAVKFTSKENLLLLGEIIKEISQ